MLPPHLLSLKQTPFAALSHPAGAAIYENEAVIGEGLRDFIAAGRRSELFLTSKVWNTHHRPADARCDR